MMTMKAGFAVISSKIDSYENEMVEAIRKMIAIKAISPQAMGEGEAARADFLERILKGWGLRAERYDYKDETGTIRSNIVSRIGNFSRTVWIVAHIDTVSEGDRSLWKRDPFVAHVESGVIYGRGASDNGQEIIAAMFAMRALADSAASLKYNFGLALVADEELGSRYGVQKLLAEPIFKDTDLFLVPDSGNSYGSAIEIAEKGLLWLRISVIGKQVHASTPDRGKNAYRYMIRFLEAVDDHLHKKYNKQNRLFRLPSTFEMTKHEKNVESVNMIPGVEVSYMDCRVLPEYSLDDVFKDVRAIAESEEFRDVSVSVEEFVRSDAAPQTRSDAEIVKLLETALKEVRGIDAKTVGIGGGTCAAFFRRKGLQTAVWCTEDDVAHQPNEYALLKNMINDAKIFAYLVI